VVGFINSELGIPEAGSLRFRRISNDSGVVEGPPALTLARSGSICIDQNSGLSEGIFSMSKIMPISEVKTRLPELVSGVAEREGEIVVTRNGKPAAVLVNYEE